MKTLRTILFILLLAPVMTACGNSDVYDTVPDDMIRFITRYFPDPNIEYCHQADEPDGNWTVIIKNGPTFLFDNDGDWISVDGNGMPLPSIIAYDQFPPELYDYIESGEYLNQIFSFSRTPLQYNVLLLKSQLTYDIASKTVEQHSVTPTDS